MAKRKRGTSIPSALSLGAGIYPITPLRQVLATTTFGAAGANNDGEVFELDLQFEDNEVCDIFMMDSHINAALDTAPDAVTELLWELALFEDPDKPDTTDLSVAATIENDSSLVHIEEGRFDMLFTTAAGFQFPFNSVNRRFLFPQPWTVARNVKVILQAVGTDSDITAVRAVVELWIRRRKASDAEFKNVIYRQRF